jgi:methionine-rich copper-binding protein CopC
MKLKHGVRFALIGLFTILPMPLAQAHAVLVFSNPAIDAHLAVMPTTVEVEFDGNLISLGSAKTNVLSVEDSQGNQVDDGNTKVAGPLVTVGIKNPRATGLFTVSWRVVSSDGHPVEGSYQFSAGNVTVPSTSKPIVTHEVQRESFWVHHRTHLLLGFGLLVAIGIWAGYERARRKLQ